jgi:Flp pilus assembly protein protease CpaA
MLDLFTFPSTLPGIEFRMFIAVAFTAAAAYFDVFNKKWVPNYLVYGCAAAAILVNIIFFSPEASFIAFALGIAVFAISYPLYKIGQLGGADVYVLASIAATIPYLPKPLLAAAQQIPYPFIFSVLVPTGLAFMLHMLFRFIPYISKKLANGKVDFSFQKLAAPAILCIAFAFFFYTLSALPIALPPAYFAVLSFLFVALLFFTLFKDEIKYSMVEQVLVAKLQEEDVLALELMDKAIVKKLSLSPLLSAKSIAALKKSKLKKAPVYTGMPFFLPYLLLGLMVSILFGDIISALFTSGFA